MDDPRFIVFLVPIFVNKISNNSNNNILIQYYRRDHDGSILSGVVTIWGANSERLRESIRRVFVFVMWLSGGRSLRSIMETEQQLRLIY